MKYFLFVLGAAIVAAGAIVFLLNHRGVSAPKRMYRIGIVIRGDSYTPGVDGFKTKMEELGYKEGVNVTYYTYSVDRKEDLPGAVQEILSKNVDLIHTYSTPATTEAYTQTKTTPIVFGSMGDPLASKTIQSLERSGTNVTGVSSLSAPLTAKRIEFLVSAVPYIRRIAFPFTADDISGASSYQTALDAAKSLGVAIVPYYVSKDRPADKTALAISRKDVDGIVISADSAVWASLPSYIAQSLKEKLPFAVFDKNMVADGGLLGYGPDYFTSGEQSAVLADKILHGQQPTDLPIEAPEKLILAVNRKTARAIGVTLPDTLLIKADVILDE